MGEGEGLDLTTGAAARFVDAPYTPLSSARDTMAFRPQTRLAASKDGGIYFSRHYDGQIRRLDSSSAAIETLAGTPPSFGSTDGPSDVARFEKPGALTANQAGRLFVTDTFNYAVREISPRTGAVTTLTSELRTPGNLAADAGENLFIVAPAPGVLRRIALGTGDVEVVTGDPFRPDKAAFLEAAGIVHDGAHNLFIVDTKASALRLFDTTARSSITLLGASGELVISDRAENAILIAGP